MTRNLGWGQMLGLTALPAIDSFCTFKKFLIMYGSKYCILYHFKTLILCMETVVE